MEFFPAMRCLDLSAFQTKELGEEANLSRLPYSLEKTVHCKRRWVGRCIKDILRHELGIDLDNRNHHQVVTFHRKSKSKGQSGNVFVDGDEVLITDLVTEPLIRISSLPYVVQESQTFIAVFKPHGLPTIPQGRLLRSNLLTIMRESFTDTSFHALNRLDKCTAGLVIFATSGEAHSKARVIGKLYLARVLPQSSGASFQAPLQYAGISILKSTKRIRFCRRRYVTMIAVLMLLRCVRGS